MSRERINAFYCKDCNVSYYKDVGITAEDRDSGTVDTTKKILGTKLPCPKCGKKDFSTHDVWKDLVQ